MNPPSDMVRQFAVRRSVPYAVLAGACILSLGLSLYVSATTEARADAHLLAQYSAFVSDADQSREQLEARVNMYLEVLRAGAALVATRTEMSPRDFRVFIGGLHLSQRYVGMEAIGFAQHIVGTRRLRAFRRALTLDGVRRLEPWRPAPQSEYYPVVFLEPANSLLISSLYDLTSDAAVMSAVERARDTGEPSATGEISDGRFLVVLPVYLRGAPVTTVDERREAILGVIVSPFNAQALIEAVGKVAPSSVVFEVYDSPRPSPDSLLTQAVSVPESALGSTLHLDVAGREWCMVVRTTNAAGVTESSAARWTLYAGLAVSFLLFLVTYSQVRAWETVVRHEEELRSTALALGESEAEARAATRAKDEFLATLSHELRTPLNAILGWVSMLRHGTVHEDRREHALAVIERNARLQADLIGDLLDVSRIVMGKIRLRLRPTPVAPIVEGIVESLLPTAEAKGVRLRMGRVPDVLIRADPERAHQIVWNLVANAVKFTPSGGYIDIDTTVATDQVQISVRDTGIGIAPEFLPHLFERFRQADSSSTRAHHGLGLGLAIVKELVHLHAGQITARSEGTGRGAEFTLSLPVAVAPEVSTVPVVLRETPAAVRLDGVRILVVDDDPSALELIGEALESLGARVSTAISAAEAIQKLRERSADVLVSDLSMPGEDGYTMIRRIRSFPEPVRSIPAIALTAMVRAKDREQAIEAGYQIHLAKPVDLSELESAVVQVTRANPAA